MLSSYEPLRLWRTFRFLHTVFCTLRKRERFLLLRPLPPRELRDCIIDLGVSFIKLAQVLATRADFFSTEYLAELRTIHDEVEAMPEAELDIMFLRAFGTDSPFTAFERRPLASASIGQVHEARLPGGELAAVKIRRLGITPRVRKDINIVRLLLAVFQPLFSRQTKNSLDAVINEFSSMILKEVDLSIELENLKTFSATYAESGVIFPRPYPEYCSEDALVMSFESGVRFDDLDALGKLGVDFSALMERLVVFYTEQMLIHGYFHCDPHPGNLMVTGEGRLVLLDFGMVKRLPKRTRVAMIELVKSANDKDFELYILACKRLGVIAASAPEGRLQELAERMFSIFDNESLSSASMQALAFQVLDSMKDFPFKLPQEVVYVMRASALIEGLGTNFIENFNGIKDILPILKRNLPRALGAEAGLFPTLLDQVRELPLSMRRVRNIITDLSEQNLHVKLAPETLDLLAERILKAARPALRGGLLVVCGFFLLGLEFPWHRELAVALFILGVLRMLWSIK